MLRRQRAGFAFEFRPAYYEQGSILHQVDTRRTRLMPVQSAIYGVTQRTGRAHFNGFDGFGRGIAIGIDPGVNFHIEDIR